MGIGGAASATLIAQCLAACLCAVKLFKQLPFQIKLSEFCFDLHMHVYTKNTFITMLMRINGDLSFSSKLHFFGSLRVLGINLGFYLLNHYM